MTRHAASLTTANASSSRGPSTGSPPDRRARNSDVLARISASSSSSMADSRSLMPSTRFWRVARYASLDARRVSASRPVTNSSTTPMESADDDDDDDDDKGRETRRAPPLPREMPPLEVGVVFVVVVVFVVPPPPPPGRPTT